MRHDCVENGFILLLHFYVQHIHILLPLTFTTTSTLFPLLFFCPLLSLRKIITDNVAYARTVLTAGLRPNFASTDLKAVLPEEIEAEVKEAAEISMGTEISDTDLGNIRHLAEQVVAISNYRAELYDYLKNRMGAIAPNLTVMVGELVGARLIAHAGSLLSLAKHPASTVQILGAEKALFRWVTHKKKSQRMRSRGGEEKNGCHL